MTYRGGQRGSRRTAAASGVDIGGFFRQLARGAQAAVDPNFAADEYVRNWERQNPIKVSQRPGEFYGPGFGPSKIVTGTADGVTPDRSQSDMYRQYAPKPFPMTPEGQFERYFKTPEMDQYFGAASRGEGAPKDVAGMEALAGQVTAPQDVPLSAYYRAQSAAGRANMPKITQELEYAEGSPLAKWAAANPMLAQRLYAKKQAGGSTGLAPDEQTVMGDLGSRAQAENPYKDTPEAFNQQRSDTESFSVAANAVPAPWNEQGEKVSAEFSGVVPFQAAKTTGEGMPQFQTTGEKTAEFLKRPGITSLFGS